LRRRAGACTGDPVWGIIKSGTHGSVPPHDAMIDHRTRLARLVTLGAVCAHLSMTPFVLAGDAQPAAFDKSVAPILIRNCLACHNAGDPKANLDLTRRETLLRGGESGPAVVPGKAGESRLVQRVAKGSMPPKKAGKRLPPAEVAALRAWVDA